MGVLLRNPYLIIALPIALMCCCDGTKMRTFANIIVSEKLDSCPENNICEIPLPLLPKDIPACAHDNDCYSGHKCCHTPCYGYKVCQVAMETINGNEHGHEIKDKQQVVKNAIEKIIKDVLDHLTTDKSIPIKLEKQEDAFPNVKVNLIYNVVKKTYVQKMNVFYPNKDHLNEDYEDYDNKDISLEEIPVNVKTETENPETPINLRWFLELIENYNITDNANPEPTTETAEATHEIIPEKIEIKIVENPEIQENLHSGTDTTEQNKPEITEIIVKEIEASNHEIASNESKAINVTVSENVSFESNMGVPLVLTIPELDISVKCGLDDEDCVNTETGSGLQDIDEGRILDQ